MVTISHSVIGELRDSDALDGYDIHLVTTQEGWLKATFSPVEGFEPFSLPEREVDTIRLRLRLRVSGGGRSSRIVYVVLPEPIKVAPVFLIKKDTKLKRAEVILPVRSVLVCDTETRTAYEGWMQLLATEGLGNRVEGRVFTRVILPDSERVILPDSERSEFPE